MTQDRIIIVENGQDVGALDMYPNTRVTLNLQLNTIGDVQNRNSTFSNTVKVPRTSKNEKLLKNVGSLYNQSRTPYEEVNCRYRKGNVFLIKEGTLKVSKVDPKNYSLVLFDGVIGLDAALEGINLNTLDYADMNHNLNIQEWKDSHTDGDTLGYVYAHADYGENTGVQINIDEIAPSFYAERLWEKIMDTAGIQYTGDFFTTDTDFPTLIVPSGTFIEHQDTAQTITDRGTGSTDTLNINQSVGVYESSGRTDKHDFNDATDTYNASYVTINGSGDLVAQFNGTLELNLDATFTLGAYTTASVRVLVNDVVRATYNYDGNTSPIARTAVIGVSTSDVIKVNVLARMRHGADPAQSDPPTFEYVYTSQVDVQINDIVGGSPTEMGDFAPDLSAKDFVKHIMQKYGLVAKRSFDDPNIYEFKKMEDILNDRGTAYDWTDKLISINGSDFDSGYAQENDFTYKYANEDNITSDGTLLVNNVNLPPSQTVLASSFTISENSNKSINTDTFGNFTLVLVPLVTQLDDLSLEYGSAEARIAKVFFDTQNKTVNFFAATDTMTDNIGYMTNTDVDWQYYIDNYYVSFKNLLDNFVRTEVEVFLTEYELYNLDLFRLVYLKQTGRYYYIERVRAGSTVRATLIEIRTFNE